MNARVSRRVRRGVLVAVIGISVLAVLLVLAAWRNDHTIQSDRGVATAEVLSAGSLRSAISFVTPDGVTHNPELGVLYPTKLTVGQRIDVEYARSDPDLVRVSGRDASVAVVPAGSLIVVTWLIAGPVIWYLRRRESSAEAQPAVSS
ncbi:DUF3592 domain-containing protein [Rhodococcus opacus]|uniref:DUF3592 domain-containing protein n=1 Tax=Rhodococcus TaxID=1827 RepID=UPI0005C15260|nr:MULTISPECIES: DUF3592 domain-containing protein [Rhodococcus]NHU44516.1 DUF3592 domain-containing protein [Rhodococcus sp. A14]MDI9935397.1 DUF3592 domain-containing protein [Rhodococcus sp. IEGM 1351]MDJ0413126.1 DUF3592 domain-containing protein [Rhodococcus opacus]MDV6240029.1 DUF3592 domain-containing protein [Rhodococcus opacus]MDX5966646.1 DUF3592 domain-containing protein [Rhodococcus opacus]